MEIKLYNINQMANERKLKIGDIYYLLHGQSTWESESNLSYLNSSVVKNYLHSISKKVNKIKECDKDISDNFDSDGKGRIMSADTIKQECSIDFIKRRHQVNMFCDIVSHLLHDDTVDATNRHTSSSKNLDLTQSKQNSICCNVPNTTYTSKGTLKKHQLSHSGKKKFTHIKKKYTHINHEYDVDQSSIGNHLGAYYKNDVRHLMKENILDTKHQL